MTSSMIGIINNALNLFDIFMSFLLFASNLVLLVRIGAGRMGLVPIFLF